MLAAMHVLAALGEQRRPLSELVAQFSRYVASGEINSSVADAAAATRAGTDVGAGWSAEQGQEVEFDELDGMTVTHTADPMWWFNLRASNTETVVAAQCRGIDRATMTRVRDGVLAIVQGEKMTEENEPAAASSDSSVPRIEPWLREILRCPQCRSTLSDGSGPGGPELQCTDPQVSPGVS